MITVAGWETKFLSAWTANSATALPLSLDMDSQYHYDLAYYIDGNTAMWRASGNTAYLDRALLYANNVMGNAISSHNLGGSAFNDDYFGWKSERVDVAGQEVPLFESYFWRYVTNLLRAMKESPAVYGTPAYRVQYDDLLAFTEKHIYEKWNARSANSYIYRNRTHMASHWAYICMNLALMTDSPSKRKAYFKVMNNIEHNLPNSASSLRYQMTFLPAFPTSYFFSDVWNSYTAPGSDVAHGNGVLAYVCEAHSLQLNWTDEDMAFFRNTFNLVVWPSASVYRDFLDGTGTGTGWFNDGFCKLGRYNQALQERLEVHTIGANIQLYGNGALNKKFIDEGSLLP